MKINIDKLFDSSNWESLYGLLDAESRSPFFTKAYYESYSKIEQGEAQCFTAFQDEQNFVFYPHIKRSINSLGYCLNGDYYDISGAYGYNGPIGIVTDHNFLSEFNTKLQEFASDSGIVTEFVRYCPITDNKRYHLYTNQVNVLDNVYIDLSDGVDTVWTTSFEPRVRKTIRKGQSYGLRTIFRSGPEVTDAELQTFFNIYNSTMQRNNADTFYFFDFAYFRGLCDNLGKMLLLSITYFEETAISTELILLGDQLAFGFLGGTLSDYYHYKANTFQRWELLKYLDSYGFKKYSMGGGASRGDSIYEFKMSFAKGCVNPFFIGKEIHLPKVYSDIQRQWQVKHPLSAAKYGHLLQGYRHTDCENN